MKAIIVSWLDIALMLLTAFSAGMQRYYRSELIRSLAKVDPDEWARLGSPQLDTSFNSYRFEALQAYIRTQEYKTSVHPEIVHAGLRFRNWGFAFFFSAYALFICWVFPHIWVK